MAFWLLKTEPDEYGYSDLERDGQTVWDGVSNPLALKHLRAARRGDRVFVYHTGNEKAIVGIAEVADDPRPDPAEDKLVVLDLKPVRRFQIPVTLAAIKADERFADFELVRQARLSVMPVSPERWAMIEAMGTGS